jgi:uncharacterized protein (DUF305 family)
MHRMVPLLLLLTLAGCSGGTSETSTTASGTTPATADSAAAGGAHSAPSEAPAADVAGVVSQIRAHQAGIHQALEAAQLNPIHDHSEQISALLDALPARTSLEGDAAQKLKSAGWEVKATVGLMHEAADRGDLGAARQQLAALDTQIDALAAAAGVTTP